MYINSDNPESIQIKKLRKPHINDLEKLLKSRKRALSTLTKQISEQRYNNKTLKQQILL